MNPRLQARKWIFAAAPKPLVLLGCKVDASLMTRSRFVIAAPNLAKLNRTGYHAFIARRFLSFDSAAYERQR